MQPSLRNAASIEFRDRLLSSFKRLERGRPADRRRELPIDLRPRLRAAAGGELVEDFLEALRREVLVVIGADLHHGSIDAGAEALDLDPGELPVARDVLLLADAAPAHGFDLLGAAQHARRGPAQLHIGATDRGEVEHGVEGRDLERADMREPEPVGDGADRGLRQPAARLLLRAPQQRDDGRGLPSGRIFADLLLGPGVVLRREGEALRLELGRGETTNGHQRSPSPTTMSIEPRIAATSASMWPRHMASIICRWANDGARILQRYCLLVPTATR